MDDADPASIEAMYAAASQCLHEKKNKRPDIAKVPSYIHRQRGLRAVSLHEVCVSRRLHNGFLFFLSF